MFIEVEMIRAIDSSGIGVAYQPIVHWSIDEHDNLDIDGLNHLKKKIENEINDGLSKAIKKRIS